MWKDSIRNIVVIFQPNILRIVGLYVRHSAYVRRSAIMQSFFFQSFYLKDEILYSQRGKSKKIGGILQSIYRAFFVFFSVHFLWLSQGPLS